MSRMGRHLPTGPGQQFRSSNARLHTVQPRPHGGVFFTTPHCGHAPRKDTHMTRKITTTSPTFVVPPLPANPPEYLSAEQAAELLFVKPRTIGAYLKSGELLGARIGRRLLIPRSEIDALIQSKLGHATRKAA